MTIVSSAASVSVVIPCYRCATTIRRAVDSVMRQTLRPAEIILVDDASGDDTLEVLRQIAAELGADRVRIVALERNVGAAGARNAGWAVATQRYLAFLDADDAWHPRKLELQHAFMESHLEVVLSGHAHRQLDVDGANGDDDLHQGYRMISRVELLLSNRFITPSAMVRREIPQRFFDGRRYMEDHLLWLEIASAGGMVARLNAELAYIFKAPFGEAGLSSRTLEMEKAELANFWHLRRQRTLGPAAAVGLSVLSVMKYLRRILLLRLDAAAGPLMSIFPVAYMSITYAITALLIAFGIAGQSELAADIAVAQGAALATFHAFSANTRNLILGHSATIRAGDILLSRLLLVVPLGLFAFLLSTYVADILPPVAAALALRRGVEWINDVHLCEKEVEHDYVFASGFLALQVSAFVAALATALWFPEFTNQALLGWAIVPIIPSLPYLARKVYPPLAHFARSVPAMLPHFGSTATIGLSIYAFRLLVVLLLPKAVAGDLFTAIAIGSFMGSMFANVYGPSLVLHQIRSGRSGFPPLLWWILAATTLVGIALFAAGWRELGILSFVGKGPFFWRAAGLALLAGVVMVFAQSIRVRLLRTRPGADIFGPDVLMHILLVAAVPITFALGGVEASILLYPLNAILALVFYWSADMESPDAQAIAQPGRDLLRIFVAFALFFPLFFKLSGEIYNPVDPVVDSGGVLRNLPIPISVLACYGGIVFLGHYRFATRSLGVVFLTFGLMLTAALVTTSGQLASERSKLLLLLQFILPAFALALGNLYERRQGAREALERGILWALGVVVPVQLVMTWAQGEVVLQHTMPFFAVYQHFQYVPLMLVGAYLIALYGLWTNGPYRMWVGLLGVLLAVYVAGSFSMLSVALLLGGLMVLALRTLMRGQLAATVLFVGACAAAAGYSYLARNTVEFAEKYTATLADERPPGTDFMAGIVKYQNGTLSISGQPNRPLDYLVSYIPRTTKPGHVFVVEGELRAGGLTIGLVRDGAWYLTKDITRPGPFSVRLNPPPGHYVAVIANRPSRGQATTKARLMKIGWEVELAQPAPPVANSVVGPPISRSASSDEGRPMMAKPGAPVSGIGRSQPQTTSVEIATSEPTAEAETYALERAQAPNKYLALLPRNLIERLYDWHLYGGRILTDWNTFLFGHPRPLDRRVLTSAHNYYLDFVYNFGVIAILPLLGLIGLTIRAVWRHRHAVQADLSLFGLSLVVLFVLIVDSNFKVTLRQPYPGIIAFFLWGVLLTRLRKMDAGGSASLPPPEKPTAT